MSQIQELPLLRRELLESSRRPRTWIVRVVIGLVLCGLFVTAWGTRQPPLDASAAEFFGAGPEIARLVILCSLLAMSLLLPAFTCSAISSERERRSLELLLLSRLSPWHLMLEKFLMQLVLPSTVLLIMAPLFGAAYALGGIPANGLMGAGIALLVTAILINSAGILCSALFESTAIAFLATFVVLLLLGAVPVILIDIGLMPQWGVLQQLPTFGQGPFTTFLLLAHQGVGGQHDLPLQLFACLPPLILSLLMFIVSCLVVVRWPHEAPLNDRRQRAITVWWRQACSKCLPRFPGRDAANSDPATRSVRTTVSLSPSMKQHQPQSSIASREIARNEQTHWKAHLGYSATLLIGLCWARGEMHQFEFILFGATFQVFFLILSLLLVLAATSNSFAAERQRQTLDMLLVLPISNRQLVSEKMAASDQIARRVLLPNALLLALRLLMTPLGQRSVSEILLHLLCTSGHLLILLSLTAWITLWFSLRMKTPVSALQGSLTVLLGLCGGPLLLASILIVIAMQRLPWSVSGWYLSSPVLMFMANEVQWLQRSYGVAGSTQLVICSLIIWGLLERIVRWRVRRDLSPLFNRLDGTECIG